MKRGVYLSYSIPMKEKDKEAVKKRLEDLKARNFEFSSGRILGSMCTEPLEEAKQVYSDFIESNLGNPGLYPGTKEIERRVHEAISDLVNASGMQGISVGGGTEGNILALWRARENSGKRKVLLPKSAHFSFEKACSLLDMTPEYVSLDDRYRVDIEEIKEKIDDETAAVVGIAGTTEHGAIDPIGKLAEISQNIYFHIDAAFGGFTIPFLKRLGYDVDPLDASKEGIDSISLDPHKMGMSPVPLGLFYSYGDKEIAVDSPYLTGKDQRSLRGTRASASIPAFWTTMNLLGMKGYEDIVSVCMKRTEYLVQKMEDIGFERIIDPEMNIASFHYDNPEDVVKRCAEEGWNISRTVNPPGLRFVVMPHVKKKSIEGIVTLLDDMGCV